MEFKPSDLRSETRSDIIIRNLPAEILMDTAFWNGQQ
ncbi:hypothetical protein T12_8853 [Trichinella patagoniensis]|uniref:Uncharacterized protein n=1 Tax=Trichinella patagoniensis TaxID=990121 RepID=A0A0V0URJ1_9BILA|nr:hypothetical protein T12_8853 [Trichinella patagoniensis]